MSAASMSLECRFVLNKKSNCARRMAVKYDGLCKQHFELLSKEEQEKALLNGNKRLQDKSRARREEFLAEKEKLVKAKATVNIESKSVELEDFNYARAKWEEERLTIQEATKKVLEDHRQLVLQTEIQAKEIEELKAQLAMSKELAQAQQQNIDSHLKIRDVIKREIERASRR
jgi:hypothetical protein